MTNIDRLVLALSLLISGIGLTANGQFWAGMSLELGALLFVYCSKASMPTNRDDQSESFRPERHLPESSILAAAMVARAAPDMLAVLKAVEFVGERDLEDGYVPAACPFCQGDMNFGHTAECALAAAIAKAEGR